MEQKNVTIYGKVPNQALTLNIKDIINQIFKSLPLKESSDSNLNTHLTSLLFRIRGMSYLFPCEPKWITVLSLIEAAKNECDFLQYRKAILDSCSIVEGILVTDVRTL